jgi:hypothetical protein
MRVCGPSGGSRPHRDGVSASETVDFNVFENPHSELVDRDPPPAGEGDGEQPPDGYQRTFLPGKATKGAGKATKGAGQTEYLSSTYE